jgi:hypothetical protein
LQKLHDEAPAGHFTLDWLMGNLHKQSFGLIHVLALVTAAPRVSLVGGLLRLIPAFQDDRRPPRAGLSALDCCAPNAHAAPWRRRPARHHPAGGDQARCRHRRYDAERAADINSHSAKQYPLPL